MSTSESTDLIQLLLNKRRLAKVLKTSGDASLLDRITNNLASIEAEVREHFAEQVRLENERQERLETAQEELKKLLERTGLTLTELSGGEVETRTPKSKGARSRKKLDPETARYVYTHEGGHKEGWNGGPGRKPEWVTKIQNAGESIEKYLNPKFVE